MFQAEATRDSIVLTPALTVGRDDEGDFYIELAWLTMMVCWWPNL